MSATISLNSKLIFCIENKDFKEYLKAINDKTDEQIKFLDIENVPKSDSTTIFSLSFSNILHSIKLHSPKNFAI